MKKIIKEFSAFFVLLIIVLIPKFSLATGQLIEQTSSSCDCSVEEIASECSKYCGNYSLNEILEVAIKATTILLGLSGSVALLFFVYGGVVFLISGGSPDKVTKGKEIIINSVIGIIIMFTSYLIIDFTMKALGYDKVWNISN